MEHAMPGPVGDEPLFIGSSRAAQALFEDIHSASRTHAKVLILGETGVGKELVAQLIHSRSARRTQRFVAVNCGGIPETLLESELFGHVRGSFTGAYRDNPGLVRQVDHGTLFLDEIGETSARMQAVLLRFAETGEIQPIGTDRTMAHTDVRLIAATHRDLRALVASGTFREDLYYRLNVIQICIAPLRTRPDDIPALLDHFLAHASLHHRTSTPVLDPAARRCLQEYAWPGNVRELKNVVERLVVRDLKRRIQVEDLPEEVRGDADAMAEPEPAAAVETDPPRESAAAAPRVDSTADRLWRRLEMGETFWTCVAEPFRTHDLTRADIRALIHRGLNETRGSYRGLLRLFNLPPEDYKRVLSFLRQHDCNVPFQRFRGPTALRAEHKPLIRENQAAS
jgi:transcriptional regulator with PAS, ATPase and Fis domain